MNGWTKAIWVVGAAVLLMAGFRWERALGEGGVVGTGASDVRESGGATVEELQRELEETRRRLEALESQLSALSGEEGEAAVTATPLLSEVLERLKREREAALQQAEKMLSEARQQAQDARSDALREALGALEEAARTLQAEADRAVLEGLDRSDGGESEEAFRASARRARAGARDLLSRLRGAEEALRDAERRVRHARRQSGDLGDFLGEQETSDGSRVALGSDAVVGKGETVPELVVLGGDGVVLGNVAGDAVVLGGDLRVGNGARVGGDAVVLGGRLNVSDEATVVGQRVVLSAGGVLSHMVGLGDDGNFVDDVENEEEVQEVDGDGWRAGLLSRLRRGAALFLVLVSMGLLNLTFVPDRILTISEVLEDRPGFSMFLGCLLVLALVPATILLVVTLVGILLIPFVYGAAALTGLAGLTALALILARYLPYGKGPRTQGGKLLWGSAIISMVCILPLVGPLIGTVGAMLGLGAVVLSRFGNPEPSNAF